MPSEHLTLCCPLLLQPSIFPSIRVFSKESVLCIRWPKYCSFSFSISTSNDYSGLISFRTYWFDLFALQESCFPWLIFILLIYCLDINTHSLSFPWLVRIFNSFSWCLLDVVKGRNARAMMTCVASTPPLLPSFTLEPPFHAENTLSTGKQTTVSPSRTFVFMEKFRHCKNREDDINSHTYQQLQHY